MLKGPNNSVGDKVTIKSKKETIFKAVMNAIIPRGGAFELGALDYDLTPRVNQFLKTFPPPIRLIFPFILSYIQISAFFHTGNKFTRLSQDKAAVFLTKMEESLFFYRRIIVIFMKVLTMTTFYEHEQPAESIGYKHGCRHKD